MGRWVLKLKEDKRLPEATTTEILKVTRELFSVLLEETKKNILESMSQYQVPKDVQDAIIPNTSSHTELDIFNKLDSSHKRKEFFRKHFNLVVSNHCVHASTCSNVY